MLSRLHSMYVRVCSHKILHALTASKTREETRWHKDCTLPCVQVHISVESSHAPQHTASQLRTMREVKQVAGHHAVVDPTPLREALGNLPDSRFTVGEHHGIKGPVRRI